MIENMRGRSTETKYGRIPLWLYEVGVPLQAIATYGWLHGRYGHYDRVMPSYGTLAKELGVSRGSVITYVKALMAAGALRIEESGAADHRSNIYVIAFNEPFAVAAQVGAGQPTDQSVRLVSPLTRTGQPADLAGQPTVHEEDVLKKTKNTTTRRPPRQRTAPTASTTGEAADFTPAELDQAVAFLQALPGRWAAGRRTARDIAPLLLEAAESQGWTLDAELAAELTGDRGPVRSYPGALKFRIEDLPTKPTTTPPPPVKPRALRTPCSCCGLQAPTVATVNGQPYCASCTTTCNTCTNTVPTDHLHDGQCLTCLPIHQRTTAA